MDSIAIGRQVILKRKELGWSQEKLGEMADISRNYVSQIEKGEAESISLKVLNKIAGALGVSLEYLSDDSTSSLTIPPALQELAIKEKLSFEDTKKLVNIPRRGMESKTFADWKALYEAIKDLL